MCGIGRVNLKRPLQLYLASGEFVCMIVKDKSIGLTLWLQWILVNSIAWGMVMIAFLATSDRSNYNIIGGVMTGAIVGFAFGAVQWISLRWWIHHSGWWILASIIGGAFSLPVGGVFSQVIGLTIFGFIVGAAQWVLLRRWVYQSGLWVLASGVGGFSGGLIGVWSGNSFQVAGYMIGGVVFGAITGSILVWLLKRPVVT